MKISDILKEEGIPSKEIKIRMSANRVLVNGEISQDVELGEIESRHDLGEFIFDMISSKPDLFKQMNHIKDTFDIGIEDMVGSNIKGDLAEFLNKFIILRFSKKEALVLKKKY